MAYDLHRHYLERSLGSHLLVGRKLSDDPRVIQINRLEPSRFGPPGTMRSLRSKFAYARRRSTWVNAWMDLRGKDVFFFPETRSMLSLAGVNTDVLHCHNLHGRYFDLRALPELSKKVPTIITLHDCWLFTGHCAHPFDCNGFTEGCSVCPDIQRPLMIKRDNAKGNLRIRKSIIENSRLHIATPCKWLMNMVERSILASAEDRRVIPNGIRTDLFAPLRETTKDAKGNKVNLLFVGFKAKTNQWKDYALLQSALRILPDDLRIELTVVGESGADEVIGQTTVRYAGVVREAKEMARLYNATDIYVHASKIDTFPNAILEASACGVPVIATSVGGIPEQMLDGKTGLLVPAGDAATLAAQIERLARDQALRAEMGARGRELVEERFDLQQQVDAYLAWYRELTRK